MKINTRLLRRFRYVAPVFCSMAVLSSQLYASPTIQLNGDQARDGMADSGNIGYVGGNTRIGVSIDRNLQGQADINQIIREDKGSATSAEAWFGYKLKDDDAATKGFQGGGVKLNHQWVNDQADTVHKVFGAYDRNTDDQSKVTAGYGQETEDLFWSGHVSKSLGDGTTTGEITNRAYDIGVGGEVGTFLDSTLTRVRAGLEYELGSEYADNEERPTRATVSAGVEQFFHDTPHSVTLDVSGFQKSGGNDADDTDFDARIGYRYEFGGDGNYQSAQTISRRRVEIPGSPGSPGRAAVPAIPATPAIAAVPAVPAQPAVPPKYERRLVSRPGHEFVKNTMKLENETFFDLNSSTLNHSAKRNLDKIISQIRGQGYMGAIRITGNTCGMGDPVYDQHLSERRANAVRDYLITHGFNPDHLIARGLGKGSPKYSRADNDFKNRRVDLEFMTERRIKKNTSKPQYQNTLVQEGRPAVPAQPGRPGRAGSPGRPGIPAIPATPATPSRFVWKTEVVSSAPVWIKRALRNTIRHSKSINTYNTRSTQKVTNDSFPMTNRNTTLLDVLANDSGEVTLTNVSSPANGTAVIEGNQIRYTPNAGFSGRDSFTYSVIDADGKTMTATVNVDVPDVPAVANTAPNAVDDSETTPQDTAINIDVTQNDSDVDNDPLVITDVSSASHGSTSIVNNQILYMPSSGYTGSDNFTYTITDNNGNSTTANVTVTVSGANVAPVANDDTRTTAQDTSTTITVLQNDTDADNDTLSVVSATNPSHGSVSIEGNNIIYTPSNGFTGTDTFDYTISDGNGNEANATVTITVEGANLPPNAVDDTATTPFETAITIPVSANDTDPEGGTTCVSSISSMPSNGWVTLPTSGTEITYTPNDGFSGTDSFVYLACDAEGNVASATVTVTVEPNNNLPPVLSPNYAAIQGYGTVPIRVLADDSDPEGDVLTIVRTQHGPYHGTATIVGDQVHYQANDGYVGSDSFWYVVTDGNGNEVAEMVDIDIKNDSVAQNSDPVITTIPPFDAPVGSTTAMDLSSYISDPDGDTVYIAIADALGGSLTFSGNMLQYTPVEATSGETDSIYVTVSDGNGGTADTTITVSVK